MKAIPVFCLSLHAGVLFASSVSVTLHPEQILGRIDERIYGHFLEHIYHSVHGGLWGEIVWNRSFEENSLGRWRTEGNLLIQESLDTNQRYVFGDRKWRDYEFTVEAKKLGGNEGFLILFRVAGPKDFYWCNLGGWGNTRHSLERGKSNEGRWHPVGPQIPGLIQQGKWYRISVRVKGPHIEVRLDGKKLIDFTDPEGHLSGRVGVGTWSTRAAFRNFQVKDLKGTILFSGMPEEDTRNTLARHWKAFGTARARLESGNSLNGNFHQSIKVRKGRQGGIAEGNLCLRDSEVYEGSLWARGKAPRGITVRFKGPEGVLAQRKLPAPTGTWREYRFSLPVRRNVAQGQLQISVEGPADVSVDQVRIMPRSWKQYGGFRPDLLEAIADLRPPVIRWPGGCFASAYRWKDGIGPQHKRKPYPRRMWDDREVNAFGTDEFVALCREVGAEPLIVVNIGTRAWNGPVKQEDFLKEVCQWIQYCNGAPDTPWGRVRGENGHVEPYNVRYWEIDNETWHMGAEAYAEAVKIFARAMKQADPRIKLAACGSGGYGEGALRWNRVIIERCAEYIDFLSIHHYENPRRFEEGPRQYEAFFRRTAELIARSENPALKLYVSEWNAQSTDWRTGLYCGGLLNAFERSSDVVGMAGPALFLRHASATAWDNAFINFDNCTSFVAPNYVVMHLWRRHYAPFRIGTEGDLTPLTAVCTLSKEKSTAYFKAVNPRNEQVTVRIAVPEGYGIDQAKFTLVAPGSLGARNSLSEPKAVVAKPAPCTLQENRVVCTFPAFSAGVAALSLSKGK